MTINNYNTEGGEQVLLSTLTPGDVLGTGETVEEVDVRPTPNSVFTPRTTVWVALDSGRTITGRDRKVWKVAA